MKDMILAKNLRFLREHRNLTQEDAAEKIGVKLRALQYQEAGNPPNRNNLQKYLDFYGCDKGWLLTGKGKPFYNNQEIDESGLHESEIVEYNTEDPFLKAISGLKEIFSSGDQTIITAIQSNIRAFQLTIRNNALIKKQASDIQALKDAYNQNQDEHEHLKKQYADLKTIVDQLDYKKKHVENL